ncbi:MULTISPECIES: N-acetyl-D-Glu racemase DgcA [unclassified Agarivorans]|uniref:N-acetyl-D-Glu racemase DgcA n=1 Tax=unclassified Agarivorans TaxID=2636026 RepID=UPI003D7CB00E
MKVRFSTKSWPIRGTFTISRGSKTEAETVIVELEDQGKIGRGECVPYAHYQESIDSVLAQLEGILPRLREGLSRQELQLLLPSGAARNAVDCALWDLECKHEGISIWQKVSATPAALTTAYTLSLDTPEKMQQAATENAFRPLLKLKLGGAEDLQRVAAVRQGAPNAKIILDANEAWTVELYNSLIPELIKLDVAMIEQPFPAGDDEALRSLSRPIPICADESCHDRASLPGIIGKYDMINIKIDKTGGLTEALVLKELAEQAGLQIMVGCMLSSSLSMAPAFVVAQGCEIVDLDGPLLLSEDIEHGFEFNNNEMLPFTAQLWG